MIRKVSGDILLSRAHAIAHGVAPNDPFSHGLAHALREHWPAMYKDFRHFCQTRHPDAGSSWTWSGAGGVHVVSLFTQDGSYDHGGKPGKATISHVNHALRALAQEIEREGYTSVALPRLATGVGSLDWSEVEPLIEAHLGKLGIPVIVYTTFHAGVAADEGLPAPKAA
jgi:O-acetyl-ADP-ribose deacetylase (regulator of RNase III)